MPNVTIDPNEFEKYELKSAPPDGYVMLRPLPYGMKLTRRDKATKMQMRARGDGRGRASQQEQLIELETLNEWATAYDFAYCVGDHNLTDKNDQLLDLSNPLTFKMLNPKVGSEIERYISELNEDEDESQSEDFTSRPTGSLGDLSTSVTDSQNERTTPMEPSASLT